MVRACQFVGFNIYIFFGGAYNDQLCELSQSAVGILIGGIVFGFLFAKLP